MVLFGLGSKHRWIVEKNVWNWRFVALFPFKQMKSLHNPNCLFCILFFGQEWRTFAYFRAVHFNRTSVFRPFLLNKGVVIVQIVSIFANFPCEILYRIVTVIDLFLFEVPLKRTKNQSLCLQQIRRRVIRGPKIFDLNNKTSQSDSQKIHQNYGTFSCCEI